MTLLAMRCTATAHSGVGSAGFHTVGSPHTAASAAWLVDGLRAKGHGDKVEHAVTILSAPASSSDPALSRRLHDHFAQLTRAVVDVPHEQSLVAGGPIDFTALSKASRDAWVLATARVAEGL